MRGAEDPQKAMFSYVSVESRVPPKHPLRAVRVLADAALESMGVALTAMYSHTGRPSIPPERLMRSLLLQIFYSIRSERLLMEQLDYNLLFRWFVGLEVDDVVWDASTFAKNRDRLVDHDVGKQLLSAVVRQARNNGLVSDEHFSVDGTLIQAWASMKSFQPKDDPKPPSSGSNAEVDFRGQKRSNDTHESKTDPECRLFKKAKGQESRLAYLGHALMENRSGLAIDGCDALLAFAIARRWPAVFSNSLEPAWVPTTMGGPGAPDDMGQAHLTQAWLAAGEEPKTQVTGKYFYHLKRMEPNPQARDIRVQNRLIAICAEISGVTLGPVANVQHRQCVSGPRRRAWPGLQRKPGGYSGPWPLPPDPAHATSHPHLTGSAPRHTICRKSLTY